MLWPPPSDGLDSCFYGGFHTRVFIANTPPKMHGNRLGLDPRTAPLRSLRLCPVFSCANAEKQARSRACAGRCPSPPCHAGGRARTRGLAGGWGRRAELSLPIRRRIAGDTGRPRGVSVSGSFAGSVTRARGSGCSRGAAKSDRRGRPHHRHLAGSLRLLRPGAARRGEGGGLLQHPDTPWGRPGGETSPRRGRKR